MAQSFAEYVDHEDFRSGLPAGRFRLVVDPKLARRFVSQRLMLVVFIVPLIGIGIALALTGHVWGGGLLVAAGVVLHRVTLWKAPDILVHMALKDRAVYEQVTHGGVMEVRRQP